MKIGMLLNAPYPSDVRVKKETDALIKGGHEVFLLCLRRKNENAFESIGGLSIERIDGGKNDMQLAFWDIVMSLSFIHPVFKKYIPAWIAKNKIQVLHVHDLPLVGTALAIRKKIPVKVVADFHENYPDAIRTWFEWATNPLARIKNKLFMNPERWTRHERTAVHASDRVIAVVEEMKTRLVKEHQADEKKIIVVTNSEGHDFIEQPLDPSVYSDYPNKFIITYSGGIGPHRGVDTAIAGMTFLKDKKEIVFVIVGSGGKSVMASLRALVTQNNLQDQVFFLGYQQSSKFYSFMHYATVNVIPHKSNGHTDNTVPHKLFQGMMAKRPLLVSSSAPLKRIVTQAMSGLVFTAGDPKDFAAKVLELYQNKILAADLADNGYKATVSGDLNWETTQKSLLAIYAAL